MQSQLSAFPSNAAVAEPQSLSLSAFGSVRLDELAAMHGRLVCLSRASRSTPRERRRSWLCRGNWLACCAKTRFSRPASTRHLRNGLGGEVDSNSCLLLSLRVESRRAVLPPFLFVFAVVLNFGSLVPAAFHISSRSPSLLNSPGKVCP